MKNNKRCRSCLASILALCLIIQFLPLRAKATYPITSPLVIYLNPSTTTATVGSTKSFPIYVDLNSTEGTTYGIKNFKLQIGYDTAVFKLSGATPGAGITSSEIYTDYSKSPSTFDHTKGYTTLTYTHGTGGKVIKTSETLVYTLSFTVLARPSTSTTSEITGELLLSDIPYYLNNSAVLEVYSPPSYTINFAPLEPTLSTATAGDGQVALDWDDVSGATGYTVYYGTAAGTYTSAYDAGSTSSATVSSLTNGTTYYFAAKATNSGGSSDYSNEMSAKPAAHITGFNTLADVSAGYVGGATYADSAAVIAYLNANITSATATHSGGTVSVPISSWSATDSYDPATAGSYTFTAVLGTLPEGYSNTENVTATVEVVIIENVELTGFSAIANIDAGKAGAATYADVAAVQTYLMTTYSAVEATYSGGTVSVPVSSWTDTDTYDASKAGSYTFTAVLGTIPTGYANTENYTATVEVIVGAGACLFEINAASDYATSHPNLRIVDYTKGSTTYHLIRGLNPNLETVSKVMSYFTVTNGTVKLYKYSSGSFVEVQSTDTITVVGTGFKVMLYDNTNTSVNTYYFLIKGDTNSDGKINNSDRTIAKNHISSKTLITNDIIWIAADINSDGKINNSDVTLIKNHISSKARITQ